MNIQKIQEEWRECGVHHDQFVEEIENWWLPIIQEAYEKGHSEGIDETNRV